MLRKREEVKGLDGAYGIAALCEHGKIAGERLRTAGDVDDAGRGKLQAGGKKGRGTAGAGRVEEDRVCAFSAGGKRGHEVSGVSFDELRIADAVCRRIFPGVADSGGV